MDISRSNITQYLDLYYAGKLDPLMTAELMMFLSENPELENLMELSGNIILQPDSETFPRKELLRKDFSDIAAVTIENFDEFCVASMEGLLDETSEKKLQDFIAMHPEKEKDARIYRQLIVKPDSKIRCPGKSMLKKPVAWRHNPFRWAMMSGIAAAIAMIVLMITGRPEGRLQPVAVLVQSQASEEMEEPASALQPDPLSETSQATQAAADLYALADKASAGSPETNQPQLAESGSKVSNAVNPYSLTESGTKAISGSDPLETNTGLSQATGSYQFTSDYSGRSETLFSEFIADEMAANALSPSRSEMPLKSISPHHQFMLASIHPAESSMFARNHEPASRNPFSLQSENDLQEGGTDKRGLIGLIRELDAWRTTQYALMGFNALTESSLSIDRTTDEQGKITALIIGTEAYTLLAKSSR